MNDQWGSRRGSQESRALQRPRHTEIPALRLLPLPGSVFAAIGHEASPNGAGEGEEQQRQLGRRTPPSAPLEDLPEAPVVTPEQASSACEGWERSPAGDVAQVPDPRSLGSAGLVALKTRKSKCRAAPGP